MIKYACQYAIMRFLPFVETGEFVNVGILLLAPRAGFFGYRLEARRHRRITQFFDGLEARTFKAAMSIVKHELDRVSQLLAQRGFGTATGEAEVTFAQDLFREIVRPREGIVRYSQARVAMTENPAAELAALYRRYVEHDFATQEYIEKTIEKNVRVLLQEARLAERFESGIVGDPGFHVTFPFVARRGDLAVKAMKALNLAQADPSRIRDHAILWRGRLEKLRERGGLPGQVLFALSAPGDDPDQREAYADALTDLESDAVLLVPAADRERLLEFARN